MTKLNARLKFIRKNLKYTQEKFGNICGKSRRAIAAYESGSVVPDDAFIKLVCIKFNINENWLRSGKGEPYLVEDNNLLHKLCAKYALNQEEEHFISVFLKLNEVERNTMIKCMSLMTNKDAEYNINKTLPNHKLTTKEKKEIVLAEIDEESKDKTSSASITINGSLK